MGANLQEAVLDGADLRLSSLAGADLREVRMDADTVLKDMLLDGKTRLADIDWSSVSLTRVDWSQAQRLGDERDIALAETRRDRITALRTAARAYRSLSIALRSQGLLIPASSYRLREQQLERKALWHELKPLAWIFSALLALAAGYGERPARIFAAYLLVTSTFAAAYYAITNFGGASFITHSAQLKWYEALVLSLSSFHGRGFFPQAINLGDPIAVVAAIEAVIGLFIELILIATFSRRFLGNS